MFEKVYCKKFKSTGKLYCYLTAVQLHSGKWAIATKPYRRSDYEVNINYPLFETQAEAEKYLSDKFKEV